MQIRAIFFLVIILFSGAAAWRLSSMPDFQFFGALVHRVDTDKPLIALTFDDGPTPGKTEQILQILASEQIKATFFLTGRELQQNPLLLQKILAAGHQVGNHSYSHQRLLFKTPGFIAEEIEKTDALLKEGGAPEPYYFRPPYGKKLFLLPWYLSENKRLTVTWDLAPENYSQLTQDPAKLSAFTVQQAKSGSIILLHVMYDSRSNTMAAVPEIIRGLKQRGFQFVTVQELLKHQPQGY
jgi:peptidoglycan/xylan/chitin deacetylase (PgdA/CDA1 family)